MVFEPVAAKSILNDIAECVNGTNLGSSFLRDKLLKKVADGAVTIIDDGTIPGGFGSILFDSEGVRTHRTKVVEKGVLVSYLLNASLARQLGLQPTGNATRGLAGPAGVRSTNFFLQPGEKSPARIISAIKEGLYVTGIVDEKINYVTGAYSRRVTGVWIEDGDLTFSVEGAQIVGDLGRMLMDISEIGNDLRFRGSTASPTIRIDGLTVRCHP